MLATLLALSLAAQPLTTTKDAIVADRQLRAHVLGYVDVTAPPYNAKADWKEPSGAGATDNTAAFQRAIDSGRPILVPPGVYYVAGSLKLPAFPAAVRIVGGNAKYDGLGYRGSTHIQVGGASLFVPATPSTYSSISKASLHMEGLSFQGATGTNAVVFDRLNLTASRITNCQFNNFKHVLYGILSGVSSFDHNKATAAKDSIFKRLASADFDPNLTAPIVDSVVSGNYFNGSPVLNPPVPVLLDVAGTSSSRIENNYIDFAQVGLRIGNGDSASLVQVRGNTFDILFQAVVLSYGTRSVTIEGNGFFRMRKASASYFTSPTAAMGSTDWTCIAIEQNARYVTITGNVFRDSERFIEFGAKWFADIREFGNVGWGLAAFVAPVRTLSRTVDEAGWNGIGQTGDGTGLDFASRRRQVAATYGTTVTPNCDFGDHQVVTATNGTAFTIAAPIGGVHHQRLKLTIRNTSGGALGAVTWDAAYKLATWTSPANGFSRSIEFVFNGTNWVETSRTPADIPN